MGWFSENSFNTLANYNAVQNKTIKKEAPKIVDFNELKRKLEKHYTAAKSDSKLAEPISANNNYITKMQTSQAKLSKRQFPSHELNGFKFFTEKVTDNVKTALVHIAKLFLYISNARITTYTSEEVAQLETYMDNANTLLKDIEMIVLEICDNADKTAKLINIVPGRVNLNGKLKSESFKCFKKEDINAVIGKIKSLSAAAAASITSYKTKTLGGKRKALRKTHRKALRKTLRKALRKTLRKTHNKKKTYMKLACKCTIRKARK